jgi:5,6,7,8-tetrahydromethanopterin hydro-lyase
MALINRTMVGEFLVGDGNEVAHIDLLVGPHGSAVESAFCNNYEATKQAIKRAIAGDPQPADVIASKSEQAHLFAAHV